MTENKVKLDNTRSRFAKKAEAEKQAEAVFNEKIEDHQARAKFYFEKISELTTQINSFVKDTTLKSNKGPIQIEMEQQIIKDMVSLSQQINQDQTQEEGLGSAGVNLLLLKIVLFQRDKINELDYKISKLDKNIPSPVKVDE